MNPIALTIGVALFILGIVLGRQSLSSSSTIKQITDNLTGTTKVELTPTTTVEPTTTPTLETTRIPTIKPNNTTLPTPKKQTINDDFTKFVYPQAKIIKESETEVVLESQTEAEKISTWYTNLYKDMQYKTLSHAKTNTNGTIVEKFSGIKDNLQINILINKKAQDNNVTITISKNASKDDGEVKIEINETNEGYL